MPLEIKTKHLSIRVADWELAGLHAGAEACGKRLSDFVRDTLLTEAEKRVAARAANDAR